MTSRLPAIIITGASGLVGRSLLEDLKDDYRIFAIARRSQRDCQAPVHPNIAWLRADITDPQRLGEAFREIATAGGADYLFHFAAYYDFSGEKHAEYQRTNVDGTRQVLSHARKLNLRLFVFASSVAACAFPGDGESLDETSPPDADHIYGWSKREGEKLVRDPDNTVPSCIVRFGAIFTDWCEYPPLYTFLNTWLGYSWKAAILAGKGQSAVPYIHVRDLVLFFRQLIRRHQRVPHGQVLIASTSGSTTHRRLFELATRYHYGRCKQPILMPKLLAGCGLYAMSLLAWFTRKPPFERPWMLRYIDWKLEVTNQQTCALLDWSPQPRHHLERRIPYLVEHLRSEPQAWHFRNLLATQRSPARPDLMMHTILSAREDQLCGPVLEQLQRPALIRHFPHGRESDRVELTWFVRLLYRLLMTSLYTSNRMLLLNYFEVSAVGRFEAGYSKEGMVSLLAFLNDAVLHELEKVEELRPFGKEIRDNVSVPIEFGIDEIEQQYENYHLGQAARTLPERSDEAAPPNARDQLEETIWRCLVLRK